MLKISRLETRFQEIVFLMTITFALSTAVGGVFYLTLNPENFVGAMGVNGSAIIASGFKLFGFTYFFSILFVLHMGHLALATSLYFRDLIRGYQMYLKSFAVYFTVLLLISSFFNILENYNAWKSSSLLAFGYGGWFGSVIGGYLFRGFGLYGALVILFSVTSVIGISAGYMEIVHSFYVMKDIIKELSVNIRKQGPLFLKEMGEKIVDFLDQKPDYAHVAVGAKNKTPLRQINVTDSGLNPIYQGGRLTTDHFHTPVALLKKSLDEAIVTIEKNEEIKNQSAEEGGTAAPTKNLIEQEQMELLIRNLKELTLEIKDFSSESHQSVEQTLEAPDEVKKAVRKSRAKTQTEEMNQTVAKVSKNKKSTKQKSEINDVDSEETDLVKDEKSDLAVHETKEEVIDIQAWTKRYNTLDLSLLDKAEKSLKKSEKDIKAISHSLGERLDSFGIKGEIIKAHQGVTLTLFEFQPAAGMKLSKIQSLSDDLALVLGAPSIRLLTPIPGKNTVGIEVPNKEVSVLRFSEMVQSCMKAKAMALPIPLGVDVYNKVHVNDLSKMPHILVSGTTGSGKSVFMNSLISSLIFHKSPKELRFLMIDPKMIELSPYNGIPHLLKPVITDVEEAKNLLLWAENEMDKRYKMFSEMASKNITTFNQAIKKSSKRSIEGRLNKKIDWKFEELPYIVIVIDELADLMLTQRNEVERPITRIAQKARAAGIHMVMATQRPSSDIVTGLIKTNFPTRVSFKVSSGIDSRTILDQPGAEKLLGNGDMLFLAQGQAMQRLQGSYMSEDEVKRVVNAATLQNKK